MDLTNLSSSRFRGVDAHLCLWLAPRLVPRLGSHLSFRLSPRQARQELNPSQCRPIFASERTARSRQYLYFRRFFSIGSAKQIIRIDHNMNKKRLTEKSLVHNREGKCLVRSVVYNNLERTRYGDETFEGWITNLCLRESKHGGLKPTHMATSYQTL